MRTQMKNLRRRLLISLAHRLPACEQTTPLLSAAMEKRLSLRQRILVTLHLLTCSLCRRYQQQLDFLRDTSQRFEARLSEDRKPAPPALSQEARERMRRSLRASA